YARAERHADTLAVGERLASAFPASEILTGIRMSALVDSHRLAEARALVEGRLQARADDPGALRMLTSLATRTGKYDEAERTFARLAELGRSEPEDLNNRAWNAALRGAVDDTALEWARQSAQPGL